MPSEFFNQLVAARREPTPPTSSAGERTAATDLQVNFFPAPFDSLATCGLCLALVVEEYAPSHADWHRRLGS